MLFFFCVFCGGGVLKCGGMLAVLMSFAVVAPFARATFLHNHFKL